MIFNFTNHIKLGVWVSTLDEAKQVEEALLKEHPSMVPHGGHNFDVSQECFEYQLGRGKVMFFMYAPSYQGDYGLVSQERAHMIPFNFSNLKNTLSKAMRLARIRNENS